MLCPAKVQMWICIVMPLSDRCVVPVMCRVLELAKAFDDELTSVALHPGGLFALVGFADKLRLLAILVDDFRCALL